MFGKNTKYKIKTKNGWENFSGIRKIENRITYSVKTDLGKVLNCTEDHKLNTPFGFVELSFLCEGDVIETIDKFEKIVSITQNEEQEEVFDIVNSGKDHSYFSSGILSHNCEFLGSTNTLISGEKLASLPYKEQLTEYSDMIVYEEPVKETYDEYTGKLETKEHVYVINVDVSEGKNLDYSAFSVIDVSCMPYKQVAVYRNNSIPTILYPSVIKASAEYYNNAFVLIEVNNTPQVADVLIEDLGYENVFRVKSGNKKAQQVCLQWGKNTASGVKMTPLVKRIGCSMLKTLIENDKLVINDFETISELTTFVQEGPSYKAEEGCNDDLAMTLVLFGWLSTQKVFKDILEHDLRKQLQAEHFEVPDEENLPVISPTNGKEIPHFIEDDSVWVFGNSKTSYDEFLNSFFDSNGTMF